MNTYETADYFRQPLLKRAHDIYSLFLVGALIGWLTIPAGSVLALAAWRRTQDATLASHFRFQAFSTLWIFRLARVCRPGHLPAQPCIFAAALEYAVCRFLWHGALCAVACPLLARL